MQLSALPSAEESARYIALIGQGISVRRHVDMLEWLQGDIQRSLPHEILIAGWGDFEQGAIQHDIVSGMPGVRSYATGTDGLPFLLSKLHERWVTGQRTPCGVNFSDFGYLLGSARLPGSFSAALSTMRSVVMHGLCDERGRHECIYVFLSSGEIDAEPAAESLAFLLPSIDVALRRITHLPQQQKTPSSRAVQEDVCGLSERETQIMAWVAMGKTNSEIGTILNISGFTVKNHMQRIFQKLNVFNRAQAVSKVTRVGLDV